MKYFAFSSPIPKKEFLSAQDDILLLGLLCMAPFGLQSDIIDLIGKEKAFQQYEKILLQWEELLSKKIYSSRNIAEDQVASSSHQYITIEEDGEVIESLRNISTTINSLLVAPDIVELTPIIVSTNTYKKSIDIATPIFTAKIVSQVIKAMKGITQSDKRNLETQLLLDDYNINNYFDNNLKVPLRLVQPSDILTAPIDSINSLKKSLIIVLDSNLLVSDDIVNDNFITVSISTGQYYALLHQFGESAEVQEAIRMELGLIDINLNDLRNGQGGLAMTIPPIISCYHQIEKIIKNPSIENQQDKELNAKKINDAHLVINNMNEALLSLKEAAEASTIGDNASAIELITAALENTKDSKKKKNKENKDNDDEEEDWEDCDSNEEDSVNDDASNDDSDDDSVNEDAEDNNKSECMLPINLKVSLLTARAEYYMKLEAVDGALNDCNMAIELDDRYCPAYALRAEIWGAIGELEEAAKDALTAFLLGGSNDLAMAAAAEEAARESARESAKNIYHNREPDKIGIAPKSWLVKSYLAGYEPLCTAFGIDPCSDGSEHTSIDEEFCSSIELNQENKEIDSIDNVIKDLSLNEIDENDIVNDGSMNLFKWHLNPPEYLLDNDTNNEVSVDNCPNPVRSSVLKDKDKEAYWLLSRLVGLLDFLKLENVSKDSNSNSNIDLNNSIDINVENVHRIEELNVNLELPSLIDVGVCEMDNNSNDYITDNSNNHIDDSEEYEVTNDVEDDYSDLYPPCEAFLTASWLLHSERAISITGVEFHSSSGILKTLSQNIYENNQVSSYLRARLLNFCSIIAYISGDSVGAVKCLRASLILDPSIVDSKIKLGSLLVDMDELEESRQIFTSVGDENLQDPIVLLHLAELNINDNEYDEAVSVLRQAQKVCNINSFKFKLKSEAIITLENRLNAIQNNKLSLNSKELLKLKEKHDQRIEKINSVCEIGTDLLFSSIFVLLGVALFRSQPANPEIALRTLQSGQRDHPNCINILLSLGEVMGQAGDLVNALKKFEQACKLEPVHPLPYVNAARAYQMLNQPTTARYHLNRAIRADPALAMTRVDLSQNLMHSGRTRECLILLDEALLLCKHVSEIKDVMTAREVARIQLELTEIGLYIPPEL